MPAERQRSRSPAIEWAVVAMIGISLPRRAARAGDLSAGVAHPHLPAHDLGQGVAGPRCEGYGQDGADAEDPGPTGVLLADGWGKGAWKVRVVARRHALAGVPTRQERVAAPLRKRKLQ
jgi:hypothetical protein